MRSPRIKRDFLSPINVSKRNCLHRSKDKAVICSGNDVIFPWLPPGTMASCQWVPSFRCEGHFNISSSHYKFWAWPEPRRRWKLAPLIKIPSLGGRKVRFVCLFLCSEFTFLDRQRFQSEIIRAAPARDSTNNLHSCRFIGTSVQLRNRCRSFVPAAKRDRSFLRFFYISFYIFHLLRGFLFWIPCSLILLVSFTVLFYLIFYFTFSLWIIWLRSWSFLIFHFTFLIYYFGC